MTKKEANIVKAQLDHIRKTLTSMLRTQIQDLKNIVDYLAKKEESHAQKEEPCTSKKQIK